METIKNTYNTIKNYNYTSKYNQTVGKAATVASDYYDKVNTIWESIFFVSENKQFGDVEFHIRKKEAVKLQSEISDYVLENNIPIVNAVCLKPVEITLSGVFGDNVIKEDEKNKLVNTLQSKLNFLQNFNSSLTSKAQQYLSKVNNVINKVDDVIKKMGSSIDYVKNLVSTLDTKQQQGFYIIWQMWKLRELITVKTDFITINNMIIQSVDFSQGEETKNKSECTIVFKQLNFATVKTKNTSKARKVKTNEVNKGKTKGKEASFLKEKLTSLTNYYF